MGCQALLSIVIVLASSKAMHTIAELFAQHWGEHWHDTPICMQHYINQCLTLDNKLTSH